ncbi:MAG: hypothetical protein ACRCY4_01075 [Brevinema sp.]
MRRFLVFLFLLTCVIPLSAQETTVNGFNADMPDSNFVKGLRLKGIGDFLYNKKAYAQAVPYYQQAFELLPTEADIPFMLGKIYQRENLHRLAELYYQQSVELYQKPENLSKTQLKAYLARVHIAEIYQAQGLRDKAFEAVSSLRKEEGIMKASYLAAWEQLESNVGKIYPAEATIIPQGTPR